MLSQLRSKLWRLRSRLAIKLGGSQYARGVFTNIYASNLWGDGESLSGPGSNQRETNTIKSQLPALLKRYEIVSLVDAPCGDLAWMGDLLGSFNRYVGIDIVQELIAANSKRFEKDNVSFMCADLSVDTLPQADAILCRDCLIHLPNEMVKKVLLNMVDSSSRYLLVTHSPGIKKNEDIALGSFRPVNLEEAPFSFPRPLDAIDESGCGERLLALWPMQDVAASLGRTTHAGTS